LKEGREEAKVRSLIAATGKISFRATRRGGALRKIAGGGREKRSCFEL